MSPTFDMFVPKNMFPQPGGAPGNKTGTLNTKSVTASMLATDSPILPHKLNGSYTQQVEHNPKKIVSRFFSRMHATVVTRNTAVLYFLLDQSLKM